MLYEPAQFEPLSDDAWDPQRVQNAIAAIVADTDAAFDPDSLWPAHEWDGWEEPLPLKSLYVGAAGVIWALDALREREQAETSLDLTAAALRTVELRGRDPFRRGARRPARSASSGAQARRVCLRAPGDRPGGRGAARSPSRAT